MTNRISYREYERRVFNNLLTECFVKMHAMANDLDESCCKNMQTHVERNVECPKARAEMARKMASEFFKDEMCLKTCTINETKKKLCEATTFVRECAEKCEELAKEKADDAADKKLELTDDDQGDEVSEEDKSELNRMFDTKAPTVTADVVAKASVQAMVDEKKKSEEIKDAIDLAKAAGDTKGLEETVARMERRGPTSLMNAINTFVCESAVRDVDANLPEGGRLSIARVLEENAEEIRARSMIMYSLYETMNAFGFKRYTEADIRKASWDIYQGK